MRISSKDWKNYIDKLSKLNNIAGEKMSDYVARHGFDDPRIIDYAYGLVTKYGEGSASLSAMMYDAIAEMEGKILPSAEVAETPEYGEVAKAINGVRKHSQNPTSYGNVVNRLVKRTGADTMLQNAERDGAEFARVPSGDTCAFCIALASRGWQHISKKTLKNGHAEHIHANCDCNYTVRFDGKSTVAGYNPEEYLEIYESAEGDTPEEKINSIRAKYRAENRDKINAQKRAAYALKNNKYDNMGAVYVENITGPDEKIIRIKTHQSSENDKIWNETYSKNSQEMNVYLSDILESNKYGELNKVITVKNSTLGGVATYDHVKNVLYVSEELIDPIKFKELVDENYFAAKNIHDVFDHELGGHKKHWESVYKYHDNNKERNISIGQSKNELEDSLRRYVKEQLNVNPNYITENVSRNASILYDKTGLNELIADAIILINKGELKDKLLEKYVKEIIDYV